MASQRSDKILERSLIAAINELERERLRLEEALSVLRQKLEELRSVED